MVEKFGCDVFNMMYYFKGEDVDVFCKLWVVIDVVGL